MSFFDSIWKNTGAGQLWDNTAGGLLWKPLKKATGLTDAQMIGLGAMAVAAPYAIPAMGASGAAGAGSTATGGLGGFIQGASGAAGATSGGSMASGLQAAGQVAGAANQAGLLGGAVQPMQAPQAQFQQGQGFAGLLNPTDQVDPEKRRQAQQMAVQGLLGGYRG